MVARLINKPIWPFVLLFLLSLTTWPAIFVLAAITLSATCSIPSFGNVHGLSYWGLGHTELAFTPSIANLLPFLWLASSTARVKQAGRVAGLIGAAMIILAQLGIFGSSEFGSDIECSGGMYVAATITMVVFLPGIFLLSLAATVIGGVIFFGAHKPEPYRRRRPPEGGIQ